VRNWIEKTQIRTSVCDLKMSYIGESPQLVSVYIREEWPPRVVMYHIRVIFSQTIKPHRGVYSRAIVNLPCTKTTGYEN